MSHRSRPIASILGLVGALILAADVEGSAGDALPAQADILSAMEHVADRQLSHPIGFDVFSLDPAARWEITRVGWDGTILSRRPCQPRPEPKDVPEAWRELIRLERDDVSWVEMPPRAQAAWLEETGLPPTAVARIQMLDGSTRGWEMGVLYHGLLELDKLSARPVYRAALRHLAEANEWRLGGRTYHADDHVVGYLYVSAFEQDRQPAQIAGVQSRFDWIMRHAPDQPMSIREGQQRWTWCDALFMAPPVWARLSRVLDDRAYLDFMDTEWWAVTEHLYSPADRLFFRDATFLERREANGARVFWSRGNGWVLAALARVIDELPADYTSRGRYLALYRDMAARVAELQPADGLWRSSLLDPDGYPEPEVSGSAFFCFALAWGVNRGHLDASLFRTRVLAAWRALQALVEDDGHLGFIQQPSAAPGTAGANSTAPYGVGAFLLAGAEVYRLGSGAD